LTSQLRRSAVSIPSNIAEGFARFSNKEYKQFLFISLGNWAELSTQIIIASRLGYLESKEAGQLLKEMFMKKLFGTDGIRGIANREPITAEVIFHIGRAGAYLFKDEVDPKILIGRDTRISGDMLEAALIAGICSAGVDVLRAGIAPTPVVAYLTRAYHANCGIVISASHNPFDHNGIKYIRGDGFKFSDSEEEEIERIYFENHSKDEWPTKKNIGRVKELPEATDRYIDYIKNTLPPKFTLKGYKIVLDCANGASFIIAPRVFKELGAEIITINDKPSGTNINFNCGSTHPAFLREVVLRQQADLGLAYDGDADRVIVVNEKGNIVDGDQIMAICALNLVKKDRLPNNTVGIGRGTIRSYYFFAI